MANLTAPKTGNVKFITLDEFKTATNVSVMQVIRNPNTQKLFVSAGGRNFKCQQDLDIDLPMKFIVNDDDLDTACLANVKNSEDNLVATL